jgi:hypothetical protein
MVGMLNNAEKCETIIEVIASREFTPQGPPGSKLLVLNLTESASNE